MLRRCGVVSTNERIQRCVLRIDAGREDRSEVFGSYSQGMTGCVVLLSEESKQ
jgi:hypothetical protein